MTEDASYDPASHYDRVTDAWGLLLGEELHYGVFATGTEDLPTATAALTERMADAAAPLEGVDLLDVGCGTGTPACALAERFGTRVLGITTSEVGVADATARAGRLGLGALARFEVRDGMDNGLPDASFDRVWALESSHLMRQRELLVAECARVLRPGGRFVLCDIIRRRELPFAEVRRLVRPLAVLREVFGDARMEPLDAYAGWCAEAGLEVERSDDLTELTRPTFERWRANAERHHDEVVARLGAEDLDRFVESCDILQGFWDDGTLGYGLLAATKA